MKIKIHQHEWEINVVPADTPELNPSEDTLFAGLTKYMEQTILIRAGMSVSRTRQAVIHELTHAYIDSFGFGYSEDGYSEEQLCEFVAVYGAEIIGSARTAIDGLGLRGR